MFVLISPTRLILMTSGEVGDAHLYALRAGLEDDITDQGAGRFGRFPAAIRIVQRLREEGRAAAAPAMVGWPGPAVGRTLCGCSTDLSPNLHLSQVHQEKLLHFQQVTWRLRGSPSAPAKSNSYRTSPRTAFVLGKLWGNFCRRSLPLYAIPKRYFAACPRFFQLAGRRGVCVRPSPYPE